MDGPRRSEARARGCLVVICGALWLNTPLAKARAESLPASVASCAALTDVLQRLACYDREVARFTIRPPAVAAAGTSVAGQPPASAPADSAPRHVAARIVTLQNGSDHLAVHLDNGDVWQQVQKADATLGLRIGDRVTVDKGLGDTYWLAGPSQMVVQVKRTQ